MHKVTDHFYGADADGNRGKWITEYELDQYDTPEIKAQIIEYVQSTGELPPPELTVYIIGNNGEDTIEFQIDPYEYEDAEFWAQYMDDAE